VHAISETSWSPGQIKVLTEMMDVAGHRLPHTDIERIAFLEEVAEQVERAATAHALTPEGAPWAVATYRRGAR